MSDKTIKLEKVVQASVIGKPIPGEALLYIDNTNTLQVVNDQGAVSPVAGSASNSFATIDVPNGTNPVADSAADTLVLDSADSSIVITGNAAGDSIDLALANVALAKLPVGAANQILGTDAGAAAQEHKTLSGTANRITVTHGAGSITLSAPQDLHTSANPQFGNLSVSTATAKAGNGTSDVRLSGVTQIETAALSSVGGGASLHTIFTMPANYLANNGDVVEVEVAGTFAANANSKQIEMLLGAVSHYDSSAHTQNGGGFYIKMIIMRTGGSSERIIIHPDLPHGGPFNESPAVVSDTQSLGGALSIRMRLTTVDPADIVISYSKVSYHRG